MNALHGIGHADTVNDNYTTGAPFGFGRAGQVQTTVFFQ
jgi:hypothetical protein